MIKLIGKLIGVVLLIVAVGWLIAVSWNVVVPYVFGLRYIGIKHGIALYMLFGLLSNKQMNGKK